MTDLHDKARPSWHSFALFDRQGALLDWNAGFEKEFKLARDLLRPGVALRELLLRICDYSGVAHAAAACGEDAAALRRRLDGPNGPPTAPHSYEYECSGRRLRVHADYTQAGCVERTALEVPELGAAPKRPASDAQADEALWDAATQAGPASLPVTHWRASLLPDVGAKAAEPAGADDLVVTRARFFDVLEAGWQHALYTQSAIAVALIDLDLQRAYTRRYGEAAAQELIAQVKRELGHGIVRSTDLVARYAEKCFALMLTGASFAIAAVVAERARTAVLHLDRPHEDSPHHRVTASVGFASTVPGADIGAQQLVEAAEAALLQAKLNGRNLVMGGAISNLLLDS